MTYLVPPEIRRAYSGDQQYWHGYELIETDVDDSHSLHEALVQARLNFFKNLTSVVIQIQQIRTEIYSDTENPDKGDRYLTTISFAALGDPNSYPVPTP